MTIRHLVGTCAVALLLSISGFDGMGAAGSDVADAVMRGDTAAVRALLVQKADVNASQADGATALHWAVYRADAALTDLLLQAGANPKVANREGFTALSLAGLNGDPAHHREPPESRRGSDEALPRGETPLMMASRTGNVAAMKVLLDRGAQVNAKETLRGTTALMWAADQGMQLRSSSCSTTGLTPMRARILPPLAGGEPPASRAIRGGRTGHSREGYRLASRPMTTDSRLRHRVNPRQWPNPQRRVSRRRPRALRRCSATATGTAASGAATDRRCADSAGVRVRERTLLNP